ncbi:hypothetical protein [Bacillus piscicola]|uniref:hypothetical protein n=1 Tax=Bacillus piscicola TaxID=1632684 RepID=UPI001F098110|nr:hypothetical protein [Bacillus piscicola]
MAKRYSWISYLAFGLAVLSLILWQIRDVGSFTFLNQAGMFFFPPLALLFALIGLGKAEEKNTLSVLAILITSIMFFLLGYFYHMML